MISPRLDLGTFCVLDKCDNQLHHETIRYTLCCLPARNTTSTRGSKTAGKNHLKHKHDEKQ